MDMSPADIRRAGSADAHSQSSSSNASGEILNGSDIMVRCLQAEGVKFIWGKPSASASKTAPSGSVFCGTFFASSFFSASAAAAAGSAGVSATGGVGKASLLAVPIDTTACG